MDEFEFPEGNAVDEGPDMGMTAFNSYMGPQDGMAELITVSRDEFDRQQAHLEKLEYSNNLSQQRIDKQHHVIGVLVEFNHDMHSAMERLETRIAQLERESTGFNELANVHSGDASNDLEPTTNDCVPAPEQNEADTATKSSVKRPIANAFAAQGVTMPGRTKYRRKTEVQKVEVPDEMPAAQPGVGMPTPMTSALKTASQLTFKSSVPVTPRTPYTPGRIGPPDSYKKTTTSINKRAIHNLDKSVPPSHTQLPLVPITDVELIVYFFNSLSRPVVSLRLYARGWGPASIVQALNEHRAIDPPYLRNTCSVKCTTAMKNGKKMFGENWEVPFRAAIAGADDGRATDMIRVPDDEKSVDYYMRALCTNLKQHPSGESAGIFTQCVKYCVENDASYTLSNVHKLAIALQTGNAPEHPASPTSSVSCLGRRIRANTNVDETENIWTDDDASCTPSPTAERKSVRVV
ncbi:hypothetical protein N0V94_004922 [Neodidymelliopsis sp. IMI 364377]|nr:hypothetical protein N0V94_004922 [Neodidymelliopsis sp. IMI 364377]